MDVKMCDRCQRVYIPDEKIIDSSGEIINRSFNKIAIFENSVIAIFENNVTVNYKSFDICPHCAKDFLNWMKRKEN